MIALVVGSVVVVLAYATLNAGVDVQDRVAAAREQNETATALRAMLTDGLRHAVTSNPAGAQGLHSTGDAVGVTSRLTFVTRGVTPPLGGTAPWRMELSADAAGVHLAAVVLDSSRAPLLLSVRGSNTLAVRFLPLDDSQWRTEWQDSTRLPIAIEVRFLDRAGRESMPAVVARTAPVSGS